MATNFAAVKSEPEAGSSHAKTLRFDESSSDLRHWPSRILKRKPSRKRAELKTRSYAEQAAAAARSRIHQATYREKNRHFLRIMEAQRRATMYKTRYGQAREAGAVYHKTRLLHGRECRGAKKAKEEEFQDCETEAEMVLKPDSFRRLSIDFLLN
ncbi:hypothetical protein C8R46DRAFT_1277466 [Mycena filopes]|nr:hypothetical protein C8R46DRAFT_1277466 [Mycena filopes]